MGTASCLLFHGPGAKAAVLAKAATLGRLLAEPYGEHPNGLKVAEAREFVTFLSESPVGDQTGVVVAGPMDLASPKSADTLLKSIEEFSNHVQPLLWARDLGGVQATIRSRCLDIWSPSLQSGVSEVDRELLEVATGLLRACLAESFWEIPVLVKAAAKRETELLGVVSALLVEQIEDPRVLQLWEGVRRVSMWRNPQPMEVISAFLPGG